MEQVSFQHYLPVMPVKHVKGLVSLLLQKCRQRLAKLHERHFDPIATSKNHLQAAMHLKLLKEKLCRGQTILADLIQVFV